MAETAILEITAPGQRGEGIARYKDQVIYVPFTLAGETIKAEIDAQRGTLIEIESRPCHIRVMRSAKLCPRCRNSDCGRLQDGASHAGRPIRPFGSRGSLRLF